MQAMPGWQIPAICRGHFGRMSKLRRRPLLGGQQQHVHCVPRKRRFGGIKLGGGGLQMRSGVHRARRGGVRGVHEGQIQGEQR